MRLLVSGGGTGGHVYPALAVLAALREDLDGSGGGPLDVLYLGSSGGMEAGIIERAGIDFRGIPSGAVVGRSPLAAIANLGLTSAGVATALKAIADFRPWVALATGGYVSVPVVVAAWLARVPSLIFLPDMAPGLAVRSLSRIATRLAVSFDEAKRLLPEGKTVVTGYPVRRDLFEIDREAAQASLGLGAGLPVVLVLGGSRGARSINRAVEAALGGLLEACQLVHMAGVADEPALRRVRDQLPAEARSRYHLYAYLHEEMPSALAAADLIVSRAGASVMGEYPAVGAASILIPYPHAGAHQRLNAAQLVDKGAAVLLEDEKLSVGALLPAVRSLLFDPARLQAMRGNARRLARPGAARAIAGELRRLADAAAGGRSLPS